MGAWQVLRQPRLVCVDQNLDYNPREFDLIKRRSVEKYPMYGGKECDDKVEEVVSLKLDSFPSCDLVWFWSAWSEWGSCAGECGRRGSMVRQRTCIDANGKVDSTLKQCGGPPESSRETRPCPDTCPPGTRPEDSLHGQGFFLRDLTSIPLIESFFCGRFADGWSDWGSWSSCATNCGKGTRARKRVCLSEDQSGLNKLVCPGADSEKAVCDKGPCDQEPAECKDCTTPVTS